MPAKRSGVLKVKKEDEAVSKSKDSKSLLNLTKALKDYHKSEKRLTLALTSAHLGIWEANIKTGEVWWSDNVPKILRIPKKQFGDTYESFLRVLPPDDQRTLSDAIQKSLESDKKLYVQHRIKNPEGSVRWMEIVGKVFRDRKGKARKLMGSIQDITDIKQSNFERKQWETRYKILASTSSQVIYDHDLITGKIKWSGTVEAVLGFTEQELSAAEQWEKQIHREDKKVRVEQLQIGRESLTPYDIRYRFKTKSKQYIHIHDRGVFLLNDTGQVWRMLGTMQDISDKVRIEKDLIESNRFKESMENAMPGLLYVYDIKKQANIYVNHNITRTLGYSWEDIEQMGNNITLQLVHPDDKHKLTTWTTEPSRTVKDSEYRLRTKSGEWRWFRSRDTVFQRDDKGNVRQVIGVAQDITERKKIEEDLRESEARFRTLQEASFGGIGLHDKGLIIDCNQGLSDITGYPRDELVGSDGLNLIAPEYRELVMNNIVSGYEKSYDVEGIYKDGTRYSLEICGKNIPYRGRMIRVTEFRDITARKIIEQKILEQNARLQALTIDLRRKNDQLEEFTQIVSHNLRSPMGNMLTLITFMESASTEEEKQQYLKYLKESSSKALTTLEELNEVLKLKQTENIEKQLLHFENVFNQVKAMISANISETSAEIRADFSQAPTIHYPNIYLESIFLNLLTNALKYRKPDQQPIIDVRTYHVNTDIILEVRDNGLGINLERYGHQIFKLQKTFHKHPESRGIGLFMIKNQIEAMGGEIFVESEENIGTTFFVNFNKHHST
jgi:PAS domain S-box-containing protein